MVCYHAHENATHVNVNNYIIIMNISQSWREAEKYVELDMYVRKLCPIECLSREHNRASVGTDVKTNK